MSGRWIAVIAVGLASIGAAGVGIAVAQNVSPQAATATPAVARENPPDVNGWRSAGPRVARRLADAVEDANVRPAVGEENNQSQPAADAPAERSPPRSSILREGKLPSGQGQVWQEYDISPFTRRVTTTKRPEQMVIDWVLRETGYEAWHSDVVSVLSADKDMLRVYHTPQMQRVVADLVDRFVNPQQMNHAYGLRVVTIGSPNWRETALGILKPIPVQAQGVQAWLLNKEDAALLLAQMSKRSDFRDYSSPQLMVYNGQSIVLGSTRPKQYARSIIPRPGAFPPYELELGRIDEGYSLELSPLVSMDAATTDAVVKVNISQIEKMVGMSVDIPLPGGGSRRERIEVPQMSSCDLHERFRWPTDQVLLVSRGVVATPAPAAGGVLPFTLPGTPDSNRADALLFIQSRGKIDPPAAVVAPAIPNATAAPVQTGSLPIYPYRGRQ
ncbi:MAG: hypothetical protein DCC68_00025 [Planctomycetota bacterium]|nr:MAG: hypothetical protein DCC68_00025 [Planctomycetota bacterium]